MSRFTCSLLVIAVSGVPARLAAQCTTNCVVTNPGGDQVVTQPLNTAFKVNSLTLEETLYAPKVPKTRFTFGSEQMEPPVWDNSLFRVGNTLSRAGTADPNSANEFTAVFQTTTGSTSSQHHYWKGAVFAFALNGDPSTATGGPDGVGVTRVSNAFTGISRVAAGNGHGYSEGIVALVEIPNAPNTDGVLIGGEFHITNFGTAVNDHCDHGSTKCKTNIWLASGNGSPMPNQLSWMVDSAYTGPGWLNGISLRKIESGGTALLIPKNTFIVAADTTLAVPGDPRVLMYLDDPGNQLHLGSGADKVIIGSGANEIATGAKLVVGQGIATGGSGFKHQRALGCHTAAAVGATCTTTITWVGAFANTGYTVTCTGEDVWGGVPLTGGVQGRSTTSVTFLTVAGSAAQAGYGIINCIAVHD